MIEGPIQLNNTNLVFCYDAYSSKSYVGQPTTNLNNAISDYTGTGYSSDGEWIYTEPTRFTKSYNSTLLTPIGTGATLCRESGTAGYHHLSRMGGGGESGAHSISCYVYPLSTITNFTIGMLNDSGNQVSFDLSTKAITYGGGIENRNAVCADVPGYPGWLRVGANIEGRYGGWVGCVGIATGGSYTPSTPYKAFYITGLQYETKTAPTAYTSPGSRSNTQGAIDLTGTGTIDLTNAAYDSNAVMYFNGTGFCATTAAVLPSANSTAITLIAWCKPTNLAGWQTVLGTHGSFRQIGFSGTSFYFGGNGGGGNNFVSGGTVSNNNWYMLAMVYDGATTGYGYLNGALASSGNIGTNGGSNGVQCIGSYHSGGYEKFQGYISQCFVYSRALSAAEILKNFNAQKSRYGL